MTLTILHLLRSISDTIVHTIPPIVHDFMAVCRRKEGPAYVTF